MLSIVRTTSTHCRLILGHTPARATGGESQGFPPSHDSGSSWSAMRKPCLRKRHSQQTLVRAAISAYGRTQPRTSDLAETKGRQAQDSAGQPRGKNRSPYPEHNQFSEDSVTRERKSQRHCKRCRTRFEILGAAVPEEGEPSPGGAANSTRSSNDEHIDQVSSSPVVQREETDETFRGSGYYRRRLELTKRELRQRSQ